MFVVEGEKARRRPVQIGLTDDEHVEIVSGVKAGEMVIVDGQAGLPDGATVSVGEDAKPAAAEEEKGTDK